MTCSYINCITCDHCNQPHNKNCNKNCNKLFDLRKIDLDKIVKELQLISKKPTTVKDLQKLMANYNNFPNHQQKNIILTCIILVVAIGVCCVLGFLIRRYKANSQRAVETENNP
jgi:hypothetical protein